MPLSNSLQKEHIFRCIIPAALLSLHLALYIASGARGWLQPFELFNLLLLASNIAIAVFLRKGKGDPLAGAGIMLIIAGHAVIGQRIAPDPLTGGALLLVNILILYTGFKVFEKLTFAHAIAFACSYFVLFFLFLRWLDNAHCLFLLALMGLAASARDFKLLAYFWALVLSFTFCQPYAWQAILISFFFLKIMFSASMKPASTTAILFLACGLGFVFFVLFPVVVLLLEEDPRNVVNILKDARIRDAMVLTAFTATISTAVLALFCIPLSYAVSRVTFYGKPMLLSLMDIPIVIPQSAAGIALLRTFGKKQFLGEVFFDLFGIQFDGTMLGICLAQIFVAMPFMAKSAIAAFDAAPAALEQSARTLGASSFSAFRRVALPLAARGLFIGSVLAWARAAGEFGAVLFIASFPVTAPVAVYNRFVSVGLVQVAPLVTTLLLFSLVMFFLLQYVSRLLEVEKNGAPY